MSHTRSVTISCELPAGVNIVVWSGDEEIIHNGDFSGLTLQLEVPESRAAEVQKGLRGLVGKL